jgi:hypothetical protein
VLEALLGKRPLIKRAYRPPNGDTRVCTGWIYRMASTDKIVLPNADNRLVDTPRTAPTPSSSGPGRNSFTLYAVRGKPRGRPGGFEWHLKFGCSEAAVWPPASRRRRKRRLGAWLLRARTGDRSQASAQIRQQILSTNCWVLGGQDGPEWMGGGCLVPRNPPNFGPVGRLRAFQDLGGWCPLTLAKARVEGSNPFSRS